VGSGVDLDVDDTLELSAVRGATLSCV
jgi:hypothetical protein